ncbi:MAG: sugar phosphate isomerase/epimerase [Pseudomonadota bacterium]
MTTPPPISVQLYSLREQSKENFDDVLTKLALLGYKGVEPFYLFGKNPRQFRQQVEDLGMVVSSTHFPWINRSQDFEQSVAVIKELGLTRAPGGFAPEEFQDQDALNRTIDVTAHLVERLAKYDLKLFLHNHYWEFEPIGGIPGYHQLQDAIPDVEFEMDVYWAANFGKSDPAEEIRRVANRVPLIHAKDGPLTKDQAHVPVGDGQINFPAIFEALDPDVFEWAVVELDRCDCDMWVAIAKSYKYLTSNNLAQGNV